MNLMSVAEVTFWHYWVFLLLQEIQNPVERLRTKYNDHDNEDKLSDLHDENEDKLSDLPDCVLLHILSFLNTKYAVQTCILSKRWKNIWKCLPSLIIGYSHFKDLKGFEYFIHGFFGTRDCSTALQVLDFSEECYVGYQSHLEWIVRYAFTHNVKRVRIDVRKVQHLQSYFFSCDTLTSLHICVAFRQRTLFQNSLNFPALTYFFLGSFDFGVDDDGRVEPFSAFKRLNSLILQNCRTLDKQNLCISSATLTNLTIDYGSWALGYCKFELYTPNLCTFVYKGIPPVQQLCGSKSNLSSVKHATIVVISLFQSAKTSLIIYNWLVELANIESLTINSTTLQVLYGMFGWFRFLLRQLFS
ncbi:putative F-box domain, leucine-rich repeat domain, L domain-containing protein [Medicago truncatula]|uniref:Putative F-box domain, leucine-rich repeat domain, L domain-containing protein n=1 Tax=Medicago truncatula TaxID=3880 RepID=A0A396HAW1_MEDTR|nr:putative F-box domain, leucine-rich repeat domain, L domain-containing protein [Medicago truncatula]